MSRTLPNIAPGLITEYQQLHARRYGKTVATEQRGTTLLATPYGIFNAKQLGCIVRDLATKVMLTRRKMKPKGYVTQSNWRNVKGY